MAARRTARRASSRGTGAALLAVAALAVLVVLGAATATPWRLRVPGVDLPEPAASDPVQPRPPDPVIPGDRPEPSYDAVTWVVVALSVAGAVLVIVLLVLLARRVLRTLAPVDDEDADVDDLAAGTATGNAPTAISLPELQDAVATALARVDRAATPHDAVVAAWVALEDAAARHGTARHPAQTSTEFTAALLTARRTDGNAVPTDDVDTLRRLYQRARFTERPIGPDAVARSRAALEHIARALGPEAGPDVADRDA